MYVKNYSAQLFQKTTDPILKIKMYICHLFSFSEGGDGFGPEYNRKY